MAVPPSPLSPSSIQLRGYLWIRLTGLQESGLPRLALSSTLVSLANCNSRKSLVASHPRTPLSVTLPPRQLSVLRAGLARARKSHAGMSVTTRTDGGVKSAGIVRSCRRPCPDLRMTRIPPSRPLPCTYLYLSLLTMFSSPLGSPPSPTTPEPSVPVGSSSTLALL